MNVKANRARVPQAAQKSDMLESGNRPRVEHRPGVIASEPSPCTLLIVGDVSSECGSLLTGRASPAPVALRCVRTVTEAAPIVRRGVTGLAVAATEHASGFVDFVVSSRSRFPELPIAFLTTDPNVDRARAREARVRFIDREALWQSALRHLERLARWTLAERRLAIAALAEEHALTAHNRAILEFRIERFTLAEIAVALEITVPGVKYHTSTIRDRTGWADDRDLFEAITVRVEALRRARGPR